MNSIRLSFLLLFLSAVVDAQNPNNTLRGKVLYQSSGNKPAVGVRIAEPDATAVFSVNNGDYLLKFQNKRNGGALTLEIGKDDAKGQKLELVNEKEVKAAKLPASAEETLDIIVCPAGQRDIAAQRYYRILRTTADRELERKKKEVAALLEQKEKDYQQISDLFAQIDRMQAALDSAKIREQAFNIASINLDRASQMVKDAVKKIDEENDVEGALKILNAEALDTAYERASSIKRKGEEVVKKADAEIQQVIEGYEFKISLLEPQFKYREITECYEKIIAIYKTEGYDSEKLATYYYWDSYFSNQNGEYQKALDLNLKALEIRKKVLPSDHMDLAQTHSNLTLSYQYLGELQKGLEHSQQALAIVERVLPDTSADLATSYNNHALSLHYLGDYPKALEFYLKAIAIQEKNHPSDNANLALSFTNLAETYGKLGRYSEALDYNLKALTIREKILPANHPDIAVSFINTGMSYKNLNESQKYLEYTLKALSIYETAMPPEHPILGTIYNNLAVAYGDLGDNQKQLEYNLQALAIREKTLPPDHFDLGISYNNLAGVYGFLGEYQNQLKNNEKALAIWEKVLPATHPVLAVGYNNIARAYGNLNDHQNQLDYHLKALDIQKEALPEDHPELAKTYNYLAMTYHDLGNFQMELDSRLKYIANVEKRLPVDDPELATAYSNAGFAYINLGEYEKALEFNLKALNIYQNVLPEDHADLANSNSNVGRSYGNVGAFEKGIDFGLKAIQIGEASDPKHPLLNRFYANLGLTYVRAHQFPEAKAALEKSESLKVEKRVYRAWAMYYALQKEKTKAVESLQKAVALGFNDLRWIETEPNLKKIHKEKGYKDVVEQLKKR